MKRLDTARRTKTDFGYFEGVSADVQNSVQKEPEVEQTKRRTPLLGGESSRFSDLLHQARKELKNVQRKQLTLKGSLCG